MIIDLDDRVLLVRARASISSRRSFSSVPDIRWAPTERFHVEEGGTGSRGFNNTVGPGITDQDRAEGPPLGIYIAIRPWNVSIPGRGGLPSHD